MAKNEEKKRWRPGRNPLTLILVIVLFIVIMLLIYIPTTAVSNYKAGKVDYFQDVSSVSDLSKVYDAEKITYYDNKADYKNWAITLEAAEYVDVYDPVFNADDYNKRVETVNKDSEGNETTSVSYENPYSGDQINFSVTITLPDDKVDLSEYSTISSSYVIYAGLSTATNWIADHSVYTSTIKFTSTNITSAKTLTGKKITCKASYPAKRTICWPVVKNVDSPDVYLYLYYKDSKGNEHQDVIRYEYNDYMTENTNGAIVKPHD